GHVAEHGVEDAAVAALFDGIGPHQYGVEIQELAADFLAKLVLIHSRLDMDTLGGKGAEERREAIVLRRRVPPRFSVAGIEDGHPAGTHLCHRPPELPTFRN